MERIKIINADCLDKLQNIEDNSIDCVITDPPYFIHNLDNKWDSNKISNSKINSHINSLPCGMKFDKNQTKNLYDFYLKLSKIIIKKIKPGGFFLSFSSPRLYHSIATASEHAGFEIRDMINWVYTKSIPKGMSVTHFIKKMKIDDSEKQILIDKYKNHKTPQIRSCFEPICVAFKPVEDTFIKNEIKYNTGLVDFSQKVGINSDKIPTNIITTENYDNIYDTNFLVQKPTKKEKGEYNEHITVKPLQLIEHLIKLFSKENATILDPFLGSGTTALACTNTNRKCIGYEINKTYYEIAKKRLLNNNSPDNK